MGHMQIASMHVTSYSYNHVQRVEDCSEVHELSAKTKNFAVKEKRVVEMLRIAIKFGDGKCTFSYYTEGPPKYELRCIAE